MDNEETPVILVIKSPTEGDYIIQCNISWTITRLKRHISDVYPSKPNPSDQRLIYYGHLLSDNETLRDILTRFDPGEAVHTIHLVCIPCRDTVYSPPPERVPTGGQPPAPAAEAAQPVPPTNEDAYRFFMNPAGYQPWMNEPHGGYFQQLAWAQQAYANYYFSQYMDLLARQNGGQPVYVAPGGVGDRDPAGPRVVDPVPPRIDDDERNRDFLDYFYMMARLIVLFSIVYFYSSPARFLIVSFLGIVMYLYQMGFFRLHPLQVLENNNGVFNNNMPGENNNLVHNEPAAAAMEAREPLPEPREPAPEPREQLVEELIPPNNPSLLALSWTFFSSFFASLIPENQNAV